jgi:hypothetical protein
LLVNVDEAAGVIYISLLTQPALTAGAGTLLEIDFQICSDAVATTAAIDVQSLSLNEGQLVLTIDPVIGADATDGRITIVSAAAIGSESEAKIDVQTVEADSLTVTQNAVPLASALDRYAPLLDLDRSRIDVDHGRGRSTFDAPSIGLGDSNDLHDGDWSGPSDIRRRIFGLTHRRAPRVLWS